MYESLVCIVRDSSTFFFFESIVVISEAASVYCSFKFPPAKYKMVVALLFLYIQSGAKVTSLSVFNSTVFVSSDLCCTLYKIIVREPHGIEILLRMYQSPGCAVIYPFVEPCG